MSEWHEVSTANFDPERLLMSVDTVAWALDCDKNTIYRWVRGGCMPGPIRIRSSVRWKAAELRQWIEGGCPRCDEYPWGFHCGRVDLGIAAVLASPFPRPMQNWSWHSAANGTSAC